MAGRRSHLTRCALAAPILVAMMSGMSHALSIIPTQVPILLELKKAYNNTLTSSYGWEQPWGCNTTQGVICDAEGHVIRLFMPGGPSKLSVEFYPVTSESLFPSFQFSVKIIAPMSPAFAKLTTLEILDLSYQQFNETIPQSLYNLTNLQKLSLAGSKFEGGFTNNISGLVSLDYLNLQGNTDLGEPFPTALSLLTKLSYLDIFAGFLTGSIPDGYAALTRLTWLRLGNNVIKGSIPASLMNLTNLQELDLSFSNITGSIPSGISKLVNLTELLLNGNRLNGSLPEGITTLTNLKRLDCNKNPNLGGLLMPGLSDLVNILPPDTNALGHTNLYFRDTSTLCPLSTETMCLGPPPVNTSSQYCRFLCQAFCNNCTARVYASTTNGTGRAPPQGTAAGGQDFVGEDSPPPSPPAFSPPPSSPPATAEIVPVGGNDASAGSTLAGASTGAPTPPSLAGMRTSPSPFSVVLAVLAGGTLLRLAWH